MSVAADEQQEERTAMMPVGWQLVALRSVIAEAQSGFASGQRDPKGVVQLRMNNVDTLGRMNWSSFLRVPATPEQIGHFRLRVGDVLFNNTNSTELVGKSALFEGHDEPVVFSNHFTRLRTHPEACRPEFLAAWLQHQWNAKTFARLCNRWIGQSAVKPEKLLSLPFPLPPLPDQRRIAAVLSDRMRGVERARDAVSQQVTASNNFYPSLLRHIFDGPQAASWPVKKLGEVLIPRRDVVHPHNKPTGTATFVGLEHIEPVTGRRVGGLTLDLARLTGRKPRFAAGDIVYGYLRPYLNKVWIAEFDGLCSVDQFAYQVRGTAEDAEYVAWFMRSPTYLRRSAIDTTTGQLPRIGVEEIAAVEMPFPREEHRRAIVSHLRSQFGTLHTTRANLDEMLSTIDLLPAALLREAFSGRL